MLASGKLEPWSDARPEGALPPALMADAAPMPLARDLTQKDATPVTEAIGLAASMLGLPYDELFQREKRARARSRPSSPRARRGSLRSRSPAASSPSSRGGQRAAEQQRIAEEQRRAATLSEARKLAGEALAADRVGFPDLALALCGPLAEDGRNGRGQPGWCQAARRGTAPP